MIRSLGSRHDAMTLSEVADHAEIPRAAARRFLITLTELGYVASDGKHFRLTPRVMELGYGYLSGLTLPDIALPHIERLVAEVKQSSEGAVIDRTEIVYILRVPGPLIMTSILNIGARMPAHATSMGKVLLSSLPKADLDRYFEQADLKRYTPNTITDAKALRKDLHRVQETGHAVVDQELEEGLCAVAVPIYDRNGSVPFAINVSSSTVHHSVKSLVEQVLPELRKTAAEIGGDLAAGPVQVIAPPSPL